MSYTTHTTARYTITMLNPLLVRVVFSSDPQYGVPIYTPGSPVFLFSNTSTWFYAHNAATWETGRLTGPAGDVFLSSGPDAVSVTQVSSYIYDIQLASTLGGGGVEEVFVGQTLQLTASVRMTPTLAFPAGELLSVTGKVTRLAIENAPVITSVAAGDQQLTIQFNHTPLVTDIPLVGFQYSLNGGASYSPLATTLVGSSFSYESYEAPITGLTNGTPYSILLRAYNDQVSGTASVPGSGTPVSSFVDPPPPYTIYAVSDRVVRIEFNPLQPPPVHKSSTGLGDALNPRTWLVMIAGDVNKNLTVLSVLGSSDGYIYDILTLESFTRHNGTPMSLGTLSPGVAMEDGGYQYWPADPFNGSIQESVTTPNNKTTALGLQLKDLNNVVTPYDDLVGGTLVINTAGDYESMSGEALLRKLVMRRLISSRGDFFHLPDYGAGLRVKETFSTANLRQLAKDLELQILREPEIQQARVTLTYQAASSTLVIQAKALMSSTGQVVALSMNLPSNAIQF